MKVFSFLDELDNSDHLCIFFFKTILFWLDFGPRLTPASQPRWINPTIFPPIFFKPSLREYQNILVINLLLFTPVVRLVIFLVLDLTFQKYKNLITHEYWNNYDKKIKSLYINNKEPCAVLQQIIEIS